jgi:FkbM family methyltransferase
MKKVVKKIIRRYLSPQIYNKIVRLYQEMGLLKFRIVYPNTKIIFKTDLDDTIASVFHSQEKQDYLVYSEFFKQKVNGFFCDIGGNHPIVYNNTLFFEEKGWKGISFEPLPHLKELWDNQRTAKLFPFALSDKEGDIIFNIVENENENGIEDMYSFVKDTRKENYGHKGKETLVKAKKLQSILDQENIVNIDYLSLDVEGHELQVLKGIDFKKIRINVLTIENNPPPAQVFGDKNIRLLMSENDYIFWGRIHLLDDIYVHRDFLKNLRRE